MRLTVLGGCGAWPDPDEAVRAAGESHAGEIAVAAPDLVAVLGE